MYHSKMQGVVLEKFPRFDIAGTITKTAEMEIEITTAGLSGTAKITVTDITSSVVALAATTMTSGSAQALASGYGSIEITWAGTLPLAAKFVYHLFTDGTSLPPAATESTISSFPGTLRDVTIDEHGRIGMAPATAADPTYVSPAISTEMVKQDKVSLTTSPQKVTLDSLVKAQFTNRSSSVVSLSMFGNEDGVKQVETATIASAVTLAGTIVTTVTAAGMAGTPLDVTSTVLGILQQESITCTTAPTADGNITMTVTASGLSGGTSAVVVAILDIDTVAEVGAKLRAGLTADPDTIAFFTVGGTGATATLTSRVAIADDGTMDLGYVDTGTTGALFGASTATTAGEAASTAAEIAEIIKDDLNSTVAVDALFIATRAGVTVILTADLAAANDATVNIATAAGTATGFTASPTSVNTTAGYAAGDWDELGGQGTVMYEPPTNTTNGSPWTFVWMKATASVTAIIRGWKEA